MQLVPHQLYINYDLDPINAFKMKKSLQRIGDDIQLLLNTTLIKMAISSLAKL